MKQYCYEKGFLRPSLLLMVVLIEASMAGAQPVRSTAGANLEQ